MPETAQTLMSRSGSDGTRTRDLRRDRPEVQDSGIRATVDRSRFAVFRSTKPQGPRSSVDRAAVLEIVGFGPSAQVSTSGLARVCRRGLFDWMERGFELVEFLVGECAEVGALIDAVRFLDEW